jgi:hypothetical protein
MRHFSFSGSDPCSPRHARWLAVPLTYPPSPRTGLKPTLHRFSSANSLDTLFAELKRERDEKQAKRISERIWAKWRDSGSATANLLMQWADKAMVTEKNNGLALDLLDQVVVLMPATRKAGTGGRR